VKYVLPFYALQKALFATLTGSDIGINWFDAGSTTEEIEGFYKGMNEFSYGIIAAADADAIGTKDAVSWNSSIDLEIYSSHKGRKQLTQTMEKMLNYICTDAAWTAMETVLNPLGFSLVSISVGNLRVNLPIYGDTGIWQSGATTLRFTVKQKE
jgi:hypothetical protein